MTNEPTVDFVPGHGGAQIAVHRLGAGRPVVLLHGLASNATINWIRYGHAAKLAEAGFEAIMIDQRAHGRSDAPRDPAAYPQGVLALDAEAVLAALDLPEYDLVGYSLGSRISAMLVARGATPRRLVLGGMGLEGFNNWAARRDHFLGVLDRFDISKPGDADYMAIQFMKGAKIDREALGLLLHSTGQMPDNIFSALTMPTLILSGAEDDENGSAAALAQALPDAHLETVPGGHMSCITKPEFGAAIATYLAA
jgi:pimeloyl-ACP methyl ester carboxylesterase